MKGLSLHLVIFCPEQTVWGRPCLLVFQIGSQIPDSENICCVFQYGILNNTNKNIMKKEKLSLLLEYLWIIPTHCKPLKTTPPHTHRHTRCHKQSLKPATHCQNFDRLEPTQMRPTQLRPNHSCPRTMSRLVLYNCRRSQPSWPMTVNKCLCHGMPHDTTARCDWLRLPTAVGSSR